MKAITFSPSSLYRWPCNQIVTKWALVFHFFCRRPALASVPSLALLRACVKRQTAAHGKNRPRVHLHTRLAWVDYWSAAFAGNYRPLSQPFDMIVVQEIGREWGGERGCGKGEISGV